MKVCVYAIMRDEQPNVSEWNATTLDADFRFVLDTGSTDGTPDDLDFDKVRVAHATFDPFRFDDARNAALALAPEADLYLRLDADERLERGWREQLEAVYQNDVPRYRLTVVNHGANWGQHTRDDLHVRPGHRWRYPTHEVLVGPGVAKPTDIVVHHHPPAARRAHHNTNLDVLAAAVNEYPGDHRMAFYYGRELWYCGSWTDARTQLSRFLALPDGWGAERAEAYRILAAIDDHPERWLWRAVGEAPDRREPWVDLARLKLEQARPVEARALWSLAADRNDRHVYTTDPQAWDENFENLGNTIDRAITEGMAA